MSTGRYLDTEKEAAAIAAMPLESSFRGIPVERVIARLKTERSLFDGRYVDHNPAAPWLTAIVLAERADTVGLVETLASLALQSCPDIGCVVVAAESGAQGGLAKLVSRMESRPTAIETIDGAPDSLRRQIERSRYVAFLRQGDRLHPSAAAWLAIHASNTPELDVLTWGELQPGESPGELLWAQRNPACQRETLFHCAHLRNAFAVSSRLAAAYTGDLVGEAVGNNLHLFQIWLTHQGARRWASHPEYFLLRSVGRSREAPGEATRAAFAGRADAYRRAFREAAPDLVFESAADGSAAPYRLRPREAPGVVSVIIPFRDKPELTLTAVAALARQTYRGFLEVILVNNLSKPENREAVARGLQAFGKRLTCRLMDFDRPFNHSQQCNEAAEASLGDVIVLHNNDCEIESPSAIEELAAWATAPGIASAGLAITNPDTGKEAAGMEARLDPVAYFDSIVEENSNEALTPFVRECFGNTFACAAVSRAVYRQAGGLDARRFPNGYNDVDFACRTRALGLRHVALGHLRAIHAPGQSRGRTEESAQKILIRTLYPDAAAAAMSSLGFDKGLVTLSRKGAKS